MNIRSLIFAIVLAVLITRPAVLKVEPIKQNYNIKYEGYINPEDLSKPIITNLN